MITITRPAVATCALVFGILAGAAPARAQDVTLQVESRSPTGTSGETPELTPGAARTLLFRITNPLDTPQTAQVHVSAPEGWQVLFSKDQLTIPPNASLVETVVVVPRRATKAGTYAVRYEMRRGPLGAPVTAEVLLRVPERHSLAVSWLDTLDYVAAGGTERLALLLANEGNVEETVFLEIRSSLGSTLRSSWTSGPLAPGETRRIQVEAHTLPRLTQAAVDTLTATATLQSVDDTYQATTRFEVVPLGRGPVPPRTRLPTTLAFRTGSNRAPGFGSYVGSGTLDRDRGTTIDFGLISREESHPLMLERDRYYVTLAAPGAQLALGDHTWSLSRLTEAGRYGSGAGGRVERGLWDGGLFVDTGRRDVDEATQAGGFLGLRVRGARASAHYLERFGATSQRWQQPARLASLRLELSPLPGVTSDLEIGRGQSVAGWGTAAAAELRHTSRHVSLYARRVRADDTYPIRDRTALIDGAGLLLRPIGQLQVEGTFDGTEQLFDEVLPPETPTRQRVSRAAVSWASAARLQYARQAWSSPATGWSTAWRRESVSAQLALPIGPIVVAPGAEQGTVANPQSDETPFARQWLRIGARLGRRVNIYARGEYGRGVAGDADRVVRRLSAGGTIQPIAGTTFRFQVHESATDVPWLEGTQWATFAFDQRLPWTHHLVGTYRRVASRTAFIAETAAYRVDYVVPLGIPLRRASSATGSVTVHIRDEQSGQGQTGLLVQIAGRSLLTDHRGIVEFTGIAPGEYYLTVGASRLPPGHSIQPALPLRVSVTAGRTSQITATVVRTAGVDGVLRFFQPLSGGLATPAASELVAGRGLAGAVIELTSNGERRIATTDEAGRFAFEGLPPGEWRLAIVSADLPPFYQLDRSQLTLQVAPGQRVEVVLRVVPKTQESTADAPGQDRPAVEFPVALPGGDRR